MTIQFDNSSQGPAAPLSSPTGCELDPPGGRCPPHRFAAAPLPKKTLSRKRLRLGWVDHNRHVLWQGQGRRLQGLAQERFSAFQPITLADHFSRCAGGRNLCPGVDPDGAGGPWGGAWGAWPGVSVVLAMERGAGSLDPGGFREVPGPGAGGASFALMDALRLQFSECYHHVTDMITVS